MEGWNNGGGMGYRGRYGKCGIMRRDEIFKRKWEIGGGMGSDHREAVGKGEDEIF